MKALLKTAVCFLFALGIFFGAFSSNALALGDFSQTCRNSEISGATLSSNCAKADGYTLQSTSINLNNIIENVDGELKFQPANFAETCRNISLSGGNVMNAECKRRDQAFIPASIDLDNCIANINGSLRNECF